MSHKNQFAAPPFWNCCAVMISHCALECFKIYLSQKFFGTACQADPKNVLLCNILEHSIVHFVSQLPDQVNDSQSLYMNI